MAVSWRAAQAWWPDRSPSTAPPSQRGHTGTGAGIGNLTARFSGGTFRKELCETLPGILQKAHGTRSRVLASLEASRYACRHSSPIEIACFTNCHNE